MHKLLLEKRKKKNCAIFVCKTGQFGLATLGAHVAQQRLARAWPALCAAQWQRCFFCFGFGPACLGPVHAEHETARRHIPPTQAAT